MVPPSASDRLAAQRRREQASRRVTSTTKTLGLLSAAGVGVLGLAFTHTSTHKATAASQGGAEATHATSPATTPATSPATSSGTAPATTTPATITPTTQAPQVTYQPPVATSGGS